jgi:hypothetical protein
VTPIYSEDQPDKFDKNRVEPESVRIAVSQEILVRMRTQKAIPIRESDYRRLEKKALQLKGSTTNWIAAGWAIIGIAVSLLGIAIATSGQRAMTFGGFATLCGLGAMGCFIAHRQVNQKHRDAADSFVEEMEEVGSTDRIEIVVMPSRAEEPPPGGSP